MNTLPGTGYPTTPPKRKHPGTANIEKELKMSDEYFWEPGDDDDDEYTEDDEYSYPLDGDDDDGADDVDEEESD